jgi:phage shock protein E
MANRSSRPAGAKPTPSPKATAGANPSGAKPAGARPAPAKQTGRPRAGYSRAPGRQPAPARRGAGFWFIVIAAVVTVIAVVAIAVTALSGQTPAGGTGDAGASGSPAASAAAAESPWVETASGGSWTNIGPATLASMLASKDFTLLNVKTPYIGEIAGTDLYIPYDQLTARASELPKDKSAKIVVYCRAGNESRVALQTLIGLGYTNLWNLDKGMESWTASGRQLIQVAGRA